MSGTWIVGGYQTDFAVNWARSGDTIAQLTSAAIDGTLAQTGLDFSDVETIHVGNAFGQLYCGQGHLGAMAATVAPQLRGVPASRHEAACASSSIALLSATAELDAGRYGCALVLGVEQERTMPGADAAKVQHAAAWVGPDTDGVEFVWPHTFDRIADAYDERYGLDDAHLRRLGELNIGNARDNPNAHTRHWTYEPSAFDADDRANPIVAGRLRRNDCCQITDGAVGLIVVNDQWLADHPWVTPLARIAGWGHATVGLGLDEKLAPTGSPYLLPHLRTAARDAQRRAGVTIDQIDCIEAHDCMTPSEYAAIDHLGLTEPGASWQAIEDGTITRTGRCPINPGGGLIGGGHPVGATGARMVLDATRQVSGTAGSSQVEGAARCQTLNIGGSTATTVSFVIEAAAAARLHTAARRHA